MYPTVVRTVRGFCPEQGKLYSIQATQRKLTVPGDPKTYYDTLHFVCEYYIEHHSCAYRDNCPLSKNDSEGS